MSARRVLALALLAVAACGRTQATSGAPMALPSVAPMASPSVAPTASTSFAVPAISSAPDASVDDASTAADVAVDPNVLALPEEPWYRDKPDHTEDCVAELTRPPRPHLPAPFAACDPRAESFTSPPGGGGLHFHYRFFSVAATTAHRAQHPKTCCYLVWEFPRRHAPG